MSDRRAKEAAYAAAPSRGHAGYGKPQHASYPRPARSAYPLSVVVPVSGSCKQLHWHRPLLSHSGHGFRLLPT